MATSTLEQIKKKVRRLTANPSPNQLSEADLEDYINTFYDQDFPSHLKTWNLHTTLEFYTVPYEDQYAFDTTTYHGVNPPLYIDGYQSFYTQSRQQLFTSYPNLTTAQTGSAGDGTAGPYSDTLTNLPVTKRHFVASVVNTSGITETVYDRPRDVSTDPTKGDLIDSTDNTTNRGEIDYVTGAVSVTWGNTVAATETIKYRYVSRQVSRPTSMLFYNNYFILRPVPDAVYKVNIEAYSRPTQRLAADDDTPDVNQWWQYVAFGAAIKVLQDRQDVESIQNIMPFFKEQENLVIYRTALDQAPERTGTIYTEQLTHPVGNYGWGGQ